jgi:DedD protein
MAEPAQTTPDDEALKKRLIGRIAVAGVIIVALLGSLAVFDAINAPPPKPATPPTKPITEPPAEPAKDGARPGEKTSAEAKVEAEPERSASTAAPAFTEPRPPTKPATAQPAMHKPSEPVTVARPNPQELVHAPESASTQHAPASRPLAQAVAAARQYLFQLGVFNNPANAEELRARLTLAGIPAVLETRVQAGPFASREEAEAARKKLTELDMQPGPIVTAKK